MRDHEMLQHGAAFFKTHYPGVAPEAVVAFLSIPHMDNATTADAAAALGTSEDAAGQYLAALLDVGGAGLITLRAVAGGGNSIHLTARGQQARKSIESAINQS